MSVAAKITAVRAATVTHHLRTPIIFGDWVIRHREFVLVRVDASTQHCGFAYGLSRDGPVAAIIDRTISPVYVGADPRDPATIFYRALRTNYAVHSSGIGMRALSLVDLAVWDLAARIADQSIVEFLGGEPVPMPATAIAGYPPSISPAETAAQVEALRAQGWRRFKLAAAPTHELSIHRLKATRAVAGNDWLGFDGAHRWAGPEDVATFARKVEHLRLGWLEDMVAPGDAGLVAAVRQACRIPVAMGDEQGGSYFPEALLAAHAVDVLRVDATVNGGITRLREIVNAAQRAGVALAPHMFPHLHWRIFAGLGVAVPIEWGVPGTGVHPMDDSLERPRLQDGQMLALISTPGFGRLIDLDWLSEQDVHDPCRLLADY